MLADRPADKPDKSKIQGIIDKLELESKGAMDEALRYRALYERINDEIVKLRDDLKKAD